MTTDNEPLDYIGMLRLAKAQYEETLIAVHAALDECLPDHRTRDDSAAAAIRRLAAEAGKRGAVKALRASANELAEQIDWPAARKANASRRARLAPRCEECGAFTDRDWHEQQVCRMGKGCGR